MAGWLRTRWCRVVAMALCVLLIVDVPITHLVAALAASRPDLSDSGDAASASQTPGDTDFVPALWVAKDTILKVAADTGAVLLKISQAQNIRAVAVDAPRSLLWAFGHHTLSAYRFDGTRVHRVAIPPPDDAPDDEDHDAHGDGPVALTVNPSNGTVWLGLHKTLYHFTSEGALLTSLRLPHHIQALALDPTRSWVWAGTQKGVSAYDDAGRVVQHLPLGHNPQVQDLALHDAASGEIWVALHDTLRRYAAEGKLLVEKRLWQVAHLASDGHGNLWVATEKRLVLLNEAGQILVQRDHVSGHHPVALAVDPGDLSVWVASKKILWHVSADGRLLRKVDFHTGPPIQDLALYVDTLAPVLTFTAPSEGAVLNTRTPTLALHYSDVGQGIDPQTLQIQAQGTPLGVTCTHSDTGVVCSPTTALPFGPVTLTATIADRAGNVSEPATIHFRVNRPPIANAGADQAVQVGTPVRLNGSASSDPDGDPLHFQWTFSQRPGESTTVLQDATTATPSFVADVAGTYRVQLTVSDGHGGSATALVTITATVPNRPPVITSTPVTTGTVGQTYSYEVEATDPDGEALTFALSTAPTGMTIETTSGAMAWTPTAAQVGTHDVVVQAQDGEGGSDEQRFTITVLPENHPPIITSTPVIAATAGQLYSYDVEATDPNTGDVLTFSLLEAPAGMTIDQATGVIAWTPTLEQGGCHIVRVAVMDRIGASAAQHFEVVVFGKTNY